MSPTDDIELVFRGMVVIHTYSFEQGVRTYRKRTFAGTENKQQFRGNGMRAHEQHCVQQLIHTVTCSV